MVNPTLGNGYSILSTQIKAMEEYKTRECQTSVSK